MKLIIAGSRDLFLKDQEIDDAVKAFVKSNLIAILGIITPGGDYISEIVSGGASGIDALGEAWATRRQIRVKRFPADWKKHGRAAGPIRNREMARYADGALVLWDGKSRGSKNMYETMRDLGKPVLCITHEQET